MSIEATLSALLKITEGTATAVSKTLAPTLSGLAESVIHNPVIVPDGASDQAISLGGVTTGKVLWLKSDQEVSVKINGSATAISALTGLVIVADITALSISNASGTDANVHVVILGE